MRFGIRKSHDVRPMAARASRPVAHAAWDDDEWDVFRQSLSADGAAMEKSEGLDEPMTAFDTPAPPFTNGFRAQVTGNDMRTERLVRDVRAELADLKQSFDSLSAAREDMVEVDLHAVVAHPDAAATLPPTTLVQALVAAAGKIKELERQIGVHEREENALRDRLTSLQDDYAYTRGRLETLHEVIAALHGNLEDLRYDRDRHRLMDAPEPRALRPGDDNETLGLQGQRGSGTLR